MSETGAHAGRVWWSYLGLSYRHCSAHGFLWAPGKPDHPILQLRPGDLVVHEYRREIVSVSRVRTEPRLTGGAIRDGQRTDRIWKVDVDYQELHAPVPFDTVRDRLLSVEPPDGPMHAELGSGKPGDLYPFNHAALEIILEAAEAGAGER